MCIYIHNMYINAYVHIECTHIFKRMVYLSLAEGEADVTRIESGSVIELQARNGRFSCLGMINSVI